MLESPGFTPSFASNSMSSTVTPLAVTVSAIPAALGATFTGFIPYAHVPQSNPPYRFTAVLTLTASAYVPSQMYTRFFAVDVCPSAPLIVNIGSDFVPAPLALPIGDTKTPYPSSTHAAESFGSFDASQPGGAVSIPPPSSTAPSAASMPPPSPVVAQFLFSSQLTLLQAATEEPIPYAETTSPHATSQALI